MKNHLANIIANFSLVVILVVLIATPMYFAKNFTQVAGVKTQSQYLLVSQVEKFPNLKLNQESENYSVTWNKTASHLAFTGVFILNNPTKTPLSYKIETKNGSAEVFFGEDIENKLIEVLLPSSTSAPVSIYAPENVQTAQFRISVK